MSNLQLEFGTEWSVWLWLLLVPLVAVALILFFRISAKQRKTRYRIISLTLHIMVAVLSVAILTGMTFTYQIPYEENELLILVDVSHSVNFDIDREGMGAGAFSNSHIFRQSAQGRMSTFVRSAIDANEDVFRIGVIAFARNQSYVAPLSSNGDAVFEQYLDAILNLPYYLDTSATNIAEALLFARGQFESPQAGRKILLITDGLETDGHARSAISVLTAEDIRVSVVHFDGDDAGNEVQINRVRLPDHAISEGETVDIYIDFESSVAGNVGVTIYNNNVASAPVTINLPVGLYSSSIRHTFHTSGAQQLFIRVDSANDAITQNNQYYLYFFIDVFDTILIIDRDGEGARLHELLNLDDGDQVGRFSTPVEHMSIDSPYLPSNLREMSRFHQIVLVNIANSDMPAGFDRLLHDYVYQLGGGLLKVGGETSPGSEIAHAFDEEDLNPGGVPSLLQQMLPVEAVDYYPPLALMIVIDVSGSMLAQDNLPHDMRSRMTLAINAAIIAIDSLSYRDYVGVVQFSTFSQLVAPLTPVPQAEGVRNLVRALTAGGGTNYAPALRLANEYLMAPRNVQNRHIMFITDGDPTDNWPGDPFGVIEPALDVIRNNEITLSIIAIMSNDLPYANNVERVWNRVARPPHLPPSQWPYRYGGLHINTNVANLPNYILRDLQIDAIRRVRHYPFRPAIHSHTIETYGIVPGDIPYLYGFFGTRLRTDETAISRGIVMPLTGPFGVPLYARWRFGNGRVGAFMTDLTGVPGSFSETFLDQTIDDKGLTLVENIIRALLPSEEIELRDMRAIHERQNYTVATTIQTVVPLDDIQNISMSVEDVTITDGTFVGGQVLLGRNRAETFFVPVAVPMMGSPRVSFELPVTGVFRVTTVQTSFDGTALTHIEYLTFSYSSEFDMFADRYVGLALLNDLADRGGGIMALPNVNPGFVRDYVQTYTMSEFNPRTLFLILVIAFFLIDIAVRKFKFKWPWEIIRDRKIKKALQGNKPGAA